LFDKYFKRQHISDMPLEDGSHVAVVGGGPAGSFFSYFFLEMAERIDMAVQVDIFESKDFSLTGPAGCNNCAGIISESLVQTLASEGIDLPPSVIKTGIESYVLHTDVRDVTIETPALEMRIGAVHRGAGPKDIQDTKWESFDNYLLGLATRKGAKLIRERVDKLTWVEGKPQLGFKEKLSRVYDLVVFSSGKQPTTQKLLEDSGFAYKRPETTKTFIAELHLGEDLVEKYLGASVHLFLLDLPRLDFAMLIPKIEFATLCLLGDNIDNELVTTVLNSKEVRRCLPPDWQLPESYCHCAPRAAIGDAAHIFTDRLVTIGDSGITRLYKDGIGAAYRTAKAAAVTAMFEGVSAEDFRRYYLPFCKSISHDNIFGKFIFTATHQVQHRRFLRQGIVNTIAFEQDTGKSNRLSSVFWDTFTGSAHYREVLLRMIHPVNILRITWNTLKGLLRASSDGKSPGG
jgi:flavin-dependent dehydrogenase